MRMMCVTHAGRQVGVRCYRPQTRNILEGVIKFASKVLENRANRPVFNATKDNPDGTHHEQS